MGLQIRARLVAGHPPTARMRLAPLLVCVAACCALCIVSAEDALWCNPTGWCTDLTSWAQAKAATQVVIEAPYLLGPAQRHEHLGTGAWEDGIYVSRDGLSLYAIYLPFDALSAIMGSRDILEWYEGVRIPNNITRCCSAVIGQDFDPPSWLDPPVPWLHADIVVSTRANLEDSFPPWQLSEAAGVLHNHGAPAGVLSADGSSFRTMAITYDGLYPSGNTAIALLSPRFGARTLSASLVNVSRQGSLDVPSVKQDNPHIEYFDPAAPNRIVLFLESGTMPGGSGGLDIWYTTSEDDGWSWADPVAVSSINTPGGNEQQPHLFHNTSDQHWWLWFTKENPADNKLAIWRARGPLFGGNVWNAWETPELIVSSGNAAGIGEPTLTARGDLSFVVVARNDINGSQWDRYDADPCYALSAWPIPAPLVPEASSSSSGGAAAGPGASSTGAATGATSSSSAGAGAVASSSTAGPCAMGHMRMDGTCSAHTRAAAGQGALFTILLLAVALACAL